METQKCKNKKRKKKEGEDRKQGLSAQKVHGIFKRISDVDCKTLGFDPKLARPDWLLITVLPVSPPAVRPFVLMDGMRASQDDITHKMYDIIKTNNALKRQEARGVPEHILSQLVELLQYHVTTMIDNEISGQPQAKQKSGKPIKSLRQRLVGKAGRVRGNLMGKRCDFSARTVIGLFSLFFFVFCFLFCISRVFIFFGLFFFYVSWDNTSD